MKTVFKTEHGSTYEIDYDNKTWTQVVSIERSGNEDTDVTSER